MSIGDFQSRGTILCDTVIANTHHYIVFLIHRMYKSEVHCKHRLWVIMTCQYRFINVVNKCTTLVGDVDR